MQADLFRHVAAFDATSTLLCTTDVRSQKSPDIQAAYRQRSQARGAALWYFPLQKLQIRIEGTLHLLAHPKHASLAQFDRTAANLLASIRKLLDQREPRLQPFWNGDLFDWPLSKLRTPGSFVVSYALRQESITPAVTPSGR